MGDKEKINLTMLTDFYELTMANGYFETGMADDIAYFDMFFRSVPDGGGFAVMAGVEQMIDYLDNLKFTDKEARGCSARNSLNISETSNSPVTYGRFPKARRYSRRSL